MKFTSTCYCNFKLPLFSYFLQTTSTYTSCTFSNQRKAARSIFPPKISCRSGGGTSGRGRGSKGRPGKNKNHSSRSKNQTSAPKLPTSNNLNENYLPQTKPQGSGRPSFSSPHASSSKKKKVATYSGPVYTSGPLPLLSAEALQEETAIPSPLWATFASSASGVWRGQAAVFSPITAQAEPLGLGPRNVALFDAATWTTCAADGKVLQRRVTWRPVIGSWAEEAKVDGKGERTNRSLTGGTREAEGVGGEDLEARNGEEEEEEDEEEGDGVLEAFVGLEVEEEEEEEEELIEEGEWGSEPGLVYFEDGSYSLGPVELLPMEENEEEGVQKQYFAPPTFKIEQCVVRGGHSRVRLQHTVSVGHNGEDLQLLRVVAIEEEWVGLSSAKDKMRIAKDETVFAPLSTRERTNPESLAGSWKVFDIVGSAIYDDHPAEQTIPNSTVPGNGVPDFVHSCVVSRQVRGYPESGSANQTQDSGARIDDVSLLWLPGGITSLLDVDEDAFLTVGVGWLFEDGTRLSMERKYDFEGKLVEARRSTEVKGGWVGGQM